MVDVVYKTFDGQIFNSKKSAELHERTNNSTIEKYIANYLLNHNSYDSKLHVWEIAQSDYCDGHPYDHTYVFGTFVQAVRYAFISIGGSFSEYNSGYIEQITVKDLTK